MDALRLGRLSAFRKPCGGVRGIVAGDGGATVGVSDHGPAALGPLWNLQQHRTSTPSGHVQDANALHTLQGLCDVDPNATIISIDGVGAFDQNS